MLFFAIVHGARHLKQFLDRQEGQGMVEYALILSLVSIAAIVVLGIVGVDVTDVLDTVENALGGDQFADPRPAPAPAG